MAYEKTHIAVVILFLAITTILVWSSAKRINDFQEYHHSIAINSVRNVSESISQYLRERKRLIQVFANEHKAIINQSALDPENVQLKAKLESEINKYFPDYFSFTITDTDGNPYYDDFDGLIGDLCLSDIKDYVDSNSATLRVHPHHDIYHYDLLAKINISAKEYIFFISFPADEVSGYLKSAQAIGHNTILASKKFENLIEVTTDGARNKNYREDYRLSKNEMSYLLAEEKVKNTEWTVYDFQLPLLFSDYKTKRIAESVFILLMFFLAAFAFFTLVKKEEKKRKKAEAIKAEFVTVVSHELRTPLTSISGAIKLITNETLGPVNDDIKKYLNMASDNIDRLTGIVNDILDVKKMESGHFQLYKENISLVEIVEQAIQENIEYAKKFNAEFYFLKPDKDYIVYADKERMLQVMANLLSNAAKYGAKQDKIKIYFKELVKSIRLNIEDHGVGISEQDKGIIFEKFTQVHSRDEEVVKGTGLGLNIIKNIIENHDGMVSYDSVKDQGTVFYIVLPLVKK